MTARGLQISVSPPPTSGGPANSLPGDGDYSAYIQEAANETGLSPDLIRRVIHVESGGDPTIPSPKGESVGYGLMQLSDAAAKDVGITNRKDPRQNILGGARYLKRMIDRFGGEDVGLAAYNAGPGTVEKAGGIPASTVDYIRKVTGAMPEAATMTDTASAYDPALKKAESTFEADVGAAKKAESAYSEQLDHLQTVYDQSAKELDQVKAQREAWAAKKPAAPGETKLPDYAPPPPAHPMQTLLQTMPMLLLFAGGMGRNKGLALMKTAGAMLNGVEAGDEEKRKRYQEDFKAKLDDTLKQAELDHQRYMDLWDQHKEEGSEILAGLQVIGAENNLDHLRIAAQQGKVQTAHDMAILSGQAVDNLRAIKQQALSSDQNAALNRIRIVEAQASAERAAADAAKVPPATRAYNEAYHEAISAGKTPDEARTAANSAMRDAELSAKPTALATMGRSWSAQVAADPRVKAYRTEQQYAEALDQVTPDMLTTGPGQKIVVDAFTRLAANQAARKFMVDPGDQGLINRANMFAANLTTTKGPVMGADLARRYYEDAVKMAKGLEHPYLQAIAEKARQIDGQGFDPVQIGAIDPEDLQKAVDSGLYKPSHSVLQQGVDQPPAATPTALPEDLPDPKGLKEGAKARDESGNVVAVIRHGKWDHP